MTARAPRFWIPPIALAAALAAAAAVGCSDDAPASNAVPVALSVTDNTVCAVLGIDYKNNVGTLSVVGLPSQTVVKDILPGAVLGDAVLHDIGGKLFIVNRLADNLTIVQPTGVAGQTWRVENQFSTGVYGNTQDVGVVGDRAYVVSYNLPTLDIYDLTQQHPHAPATWVALPGFDPDGIPNAQGIYIDGARAYVTLDLLDSSFQARGVGKVVTIDTAANQIVGALDLHYSNPYNFLVPYGSGQALVVTEGDFSGATGCVERLALGDAPQVMPCLVTDLDAGGTIGALAVTARKDVYFTVSTYDADFHPTSVVRSISAAGALGPAITPAGQTPSDLAYAAGTEQLVYSDAKAGGLRIYDVIAGREVTTAALDIGLPPGAINDIVCMPRP
jgi:hypothetical protein